MKRIIYKGLFGILTALFALFMNPVIIYTENIKLPQKEPLNAQMIMDVIVRQSQDKRIDGFELSYDDAQMLMKIAMAEAEGEGIKGKAMVMAVVLNRVDSPDFPNNVHDVIFQEYKGVYQFSPVEDGRYYEIEPDIDCHIALAEIERGEYDTVDALYFENAKASWQQGNCEYLGTIGNHRFYK